jgi:hypothetical protein
MPASDPITAIGNVVDTVLSRVIPDPQAQMQAKLAAGQMILSGELATLTAQSGIITAEANSTNKFVSSWRPSLMYCFIAIIFNNYLLAPYLQAMFHVGLQLQIPDQMWDLIRLGVGGYVGGRSLEKIAGGKGVKGIIGGVLNGPAQSQPQPAQSQDSQSIFKGN